MHISEGVLNWQILSVGGCLSTAGVALGLKKLKNEEIPKTAVLTSAFFVASLIHIPIGMTSAHLVLNGLLGILLGWAAFPAILIALILQALLFQFGGFTSLGVNTFNMALPSVLCFYLFGWLVRSESKVLPLVGGTLSGALSVLLSALLVALSLYLSSSEMKTPAFAVVLTHIPVAAVEAVITALIVSFLKSVKPQTFMRREVND
ncbi:MAG: cobalt transporter CbiM [Planctomycetota bacterium]|nr:cobalt transporter CbiM [Planctomycetota bacterium]